MEEPSYTVYSSEYNADNGHKEDICYSVYIFVCRIKSGYFHVDSIEVVGRKYGRPPGEQE